MPFGNVLEYVMTVLFLNIELNKQVPVFLQTYHLQETKTTGCDKIRHK